MRSFVVNHRKINLQFTIPCVLTLSLMTGVQSSFAKPPSAEEMWEMIQQQQQVIAELKARLDETDQRVAVNEEKVEENAEEVEAATEAFETASSSSGSGWWDKTSIGGYGELHYVHYILLIALLSVLKSTLVII